MARRRRKATRRRRDTSLKILNLAEGYVQANIVTEALMRTNPIEFAVGDVVPGIASGGGISLVELLRRPDLIGTIGARASDPRNIANIAIQSALANVAFKFGKRALRRPINLMNRTVFKPLALGVKL